MYILTFLGSLKSDGPLRNSRNALFGGMLASSIAAFAISYSTAWSVRVVSSTTYSMTGALNKLPVALSGMIFFPAERRVSNTGNILSVLIAFSSGIVYSLAQIRQRASGRKDVKHVPLPTQIPSPPLHELRPISPK